MVRGGHFLPQFHCLLEGLQARRILSHIPQQAPLLPEYSGSLALVLVG